MFDLRVFRKQNKLSQIDTAHLFGCAQSFISQIEKGKRPIPDEFISIIKANKKYKIDDTINDHSTLPGVKCINPDCLNKIADLTRELGLVNKINRLLEKQIEQLEAEKGVLEPEKRDQGSVEKPRESKKAS